MKLRFSDTDATGPRGGQAVARLILRPGETVSFTPLRRGTAVVCISGIVHVTQAGDARDYVLREGDSAQMGARGKVVMSCFRGPAAVLIEGGRRRQREPGDPMREERACQTA